MKPKMSEATHRVITTKETIMNQEDKKLICAMADTRAIAGIGIARYQESIEEGYSKQEALELAIELVLHLNEE